MTDASSACAVTLLRGADLVASPWKNGGGVTREVAAFPHGAALDTFVWRISVADVAQSGPFSRFPGMDRTLVLLSGAGMMLDEAPGRTHALTHALDIAQFDGETDIDARLIDGPTRDFNLMLRRGAASADVEVWRGPTQRTLNADIVLLFCAESANGINVSAGDHAPQALVRDDTLRIDAPRALRCTTHGDGALLVVSIRYA
ncbi:HutD family protein [Paraburkholderia sp.]|uniref:HutD/Ves family protein n=1 Tax=Paraburkholderia sp. TaxID=1926495 RepID=UPI00238EB18E|nr:HutD family protein [Paraburkholderia sp.]MDE1184553.1 HutD family protein [Paraburkholderia sp.]